MQKARLSVMVACIDSWCQPCKVSAELNFGFHISFCSSCFLPLHWHRRRQAFSINLPPAGISDEVFSLQSADVLSYHIAPTTSMFTPGVLLLALSSYPDFALTQQQPLGTGKCEKKARPPSPPCAMLDEMPPGGGAKKKPPTFLMVSL